MKFSQRIGINPAVKLVQKDSIDDELRNSLWNAITVTYLETVEFGNSSYDCVQWSNREHMIKRIWINHLKMTIDEIPYNFSDTVRYLKQRFFKAEWFEQLDFVETLPRWENEDLAKSYWKLCNVFLERENSAYRFINGQLSEITSDTEIEAVETAIQLAGSYGGARHHLQSALSLMNDRDSPDYRNSIKESISAVESVAKTISGGDGATLPQALKAAGFGERLHPALLKGFSNLYGYTSDAEGIRHALLDKPTLKKSDAIYMVVTCSAFVNYLIALANE